MRIRDLLSNWESHAQGSLSPEALRVHLPVEDVAKLQALAEMYPRRSREQIITELLSAALEELESSLPYVRGRNIVERDEMGDPLYEDAGPTPRYLALTQKYLDDYRRRKSEHH